MSKKFFALLAAASIVSAAVQAQVRNEKVQLFEVELGAGFHPSATLTYGAPGVKKGHELAPQFFAELRTNIDRGNIDLAVRFDFAKNLKDVDNMQIDSRIGTLSVFGDYNFMRGSKLSPFVGLGAGISAAKMHPCMTLETAYENGSITADRYEEEMNNGNSLISFEGERDNAFVLTPRVGVEFINRIRLSAEYRITARRYSFFGLNLGVVIGGNYMKNKK